MTRSFTAVDMVKLPNLNVPAAIALGTKLVTWAEAAGPLTPAITTALGRMREALEALSEVARNRLAEAGANTGAKREADRVLDAAWGALHGLCNGWAKSPYPSERTAAAAVLRDALFAEGLRFTQLKYRQQWVESQARVNFIDRQGLDEHIALLGGTELLDNIRRAHTRYGQVLGITEIMEKTSVTAGERLGEFLIDVRRYVVQVSAYGDSAVSGAEELATHLLMPLRTWKTGAAAGQESGEAEPDSSDPAEAVAADPAAPPAMPDAEPEDGPLG